MGDTRTARLALARSLSARLLRLVDMGGDELRVIDAFVTELEHRADEHGQLDVDAAILAACERVAERRRQVAAIEAGLDEIVNTAPVVARTYAVDFGEGGLDFRPTGEVVHAIRVVDHAEHCHATVPSPDRPDGGCICGAWKTRPTRVLGSPPRPEGDR